MTLTWRNTRGGIKKTTLPDGRVLSYRRSVSPRTNAGWYALVEWTVIMEWPQGTSGEIIRADLARWVEERFPLQALAWVSADKQSTNER